MKRFSVWLLLFIPIAIIGYWSSSYSLRPFPKKASFSSKNISQTQNPCVGIQYKMPTAPFEGWSDAQYQAEADFTHQLLQCETDIGKRQVLYRRHLRASNIVGKYDYVMQKADSLLPSMPDSIKASLHRFIVYALQLKGEDDKAEYIYHSFKSAQLADSVKNPVERFNVYTSAALSANDMQYNKLVQALYGKMEQVLKTYPDPYQKARLLTYKLDFYLVENDLPSSKQSLTPLILQIAKELEPYLPLIKQKAEYQYTLSKRAIALAYLLEKKYDKALSDLEEVYQISMQIQNPDYAVLALYCMSQTFYYQQKYALADEKLTEAISMIRAQGSSLYEDLVYFWRGKTQEALGNLTEAEHFYRLSLKLQDAELAEAQTFHWNGMRLTDRQAGYRNLVRVLLKQGRATEAFVLLETHRATFLQHLRKYAQLVNKAEPHWKPQLNSLDRQRKEILALSDAQSLSSLLSDGLLQYEKNALWISLQKSQQDSTSITWSDSLFLPKLQTQLKKQEKTLVSYFLDEEYDAFQGTTQRPSWAFVVTEKGVYAKELELTNAEIQTKLQKVHPFFDANVTKRNAPNGFDLVALHEVHNTIFAPIRPLLGKTRNLVIIPEKSLLSFPFSMLVNTPPSQRFRFDLAKYLLEEFAISYDHAAIFMLDNTSQKSSFSFDVLAFGRSDFANTPLESLSGVTAEMKSVTQTIPRSLSYLNKDATLSLWHQYSPSAQVLHLASHTKLNFQNPLYTSFYIGGDEQLYLYDVYNQQLQSQLVALSGCSTAQGALIDGEGLEGLQYAFRASGVQSIASTLWTADDAHYAQMMQLFYTQLRQGKSKSEALQHAQRLLSKKRGISPFSWASMVLYGNTDALTFSAESSVNPFSLESLFGWLGLLGLSSLMFWFFLKRKSLWGILK